MKPKNGKKFEGAIIGFGFISSQGHAPAYLKRLEEQNDFEIIAVADICEARLEEAKKIFPQAKIYHSAQELIQNESMNLDFVDISTPPCDHASIATLALDAGLHVLCEKPLTTTLSEASFLLSKALHSKRVLFPCHNYKHAPVVKAINEIIRSGRIGKVRSVTLNTFRNTHAKGVPEWKTHWRREKKYSGGGIAMDHGSHSFYLTFDWLGSYPTSVTAKMDNLAPDLYDTEDNFNAVLTFPNGLAFSTLMWTSGTRKVIYTVQAERGAITVEDDNLECAMMKPKPGEDVSYGAVEWEFERSKIKSNWMDSSHVSWFNSLLDQFKAAVLGDEYVGKEAKEAYYCIQVITQAYKSAENFCVEMPLSQEITMG